MEQPSRGTRRQTPTHAAEHAHGTTPERQRPIEAIRVQVQRAALRIARTERSSVRRGAVVVRKVAGPTALGLGPSIRETQRHRDPRAAQLRPHHEVGHRASPEPLVAEPPPAPQVSAEADHAAARIAGYQRGQCPVAERAVDEELSELALELGARPQRRPDEAGAIQIDHGLEVARLHRPHGDLRRCHRLPPTCARFSHSTRAPLSQRSEVTAAGCAPQARLKRARPSLPSLMPPRFTHSRPRSSACRRAWR